MKLTFERMKKIDVTHPVSDGDFCFMLPYPEMGGGRVTSILDMITPQVIKGKHYYIVKELKV